MKKVRGTQSERKMAKQQLEKFVSTPLYTHLLPHTSTPAFAAVMIVILIDSFSSHSLPVAVTEVKTKNIAAVRQPSRRISAQLRLETCVSPPLHCLLRDRGGVIIVFSTGTDHGSRITVRSASGKPPAVTRRSVCSARAAFRQRSNC